MIFVTVENMLLSMGDTRNTGLLILDWGCLLFSYWRDQLGLEGHSHLQLVNVPGNILLFISGYLSWWKNAAQPCQTAIESSLNFHLLFCRVVYEMRLFGYLVKYILKCLSESIAFCVDYFYEEIIIIIVLIKYSLHYCKNNVFFCREGVWLHKLKKLDVYFIAW